MVIIYNKANRPIGIANQSVLPLKEIKLQDKHAYCDVYDEDGNPTGERQLLPGLVALETMGFVTIKEEKQAAKKAEPTAEDKSAEDKAEEKVEEKPKKGRKSKKTEE